jgi:small-conductance mechanosensitive channel
MYKYIFTLPKTFTQDNVNLIIKIIIYTSNRISVNDLYLLHFYTTSICVFIFNLSTLILARILGMSQCWSIIYFKKNLLSRFQHLNFFKRFSMCGFEHTSSKFQALYIILVLAHFFKFKNLHVQFKNHLNSMYILHIPQDCKLYRYEIL